MSDDQDTGSVTSLDDVRRGKQLRRREPISLWKPGAVFTEIARMMAAGQLTPSEVVVVTREPAAGKPGAFKVRCFAGGAINDTHTFMGLLEDGKRFLQLQSVEKIDG
jgi:hypothetical protein